MAISPKGRIGTSAGFAAQHGITKSMRADLYWDAKSHAIAISFVPKDVQSAFPTIVAANGSVAIPHTARFFGVNGMDAAQVAARYPFEVRTAKAVGITDKAADAEVFIIALKAVNAERARVSLTR